MRAGKDIVWFCQSCLLEQPIAESTRVHQSEEFNPPVSSSATDSETSVDILESEEFNPPVSSSATDSFEQSTVYDLLAQPSIEEATIEEPMPHPVEPVNQPLTFHIVEGASERGKRKLLDSWGYSYNVKRQHVNATDWQCTVRPMVRN